MIRAEGLCKTLAGRAVLHGASLEIPDGSTVGLYGRSGIGKTTIARLLCGLLLPDAGEIRVDGELLSCRRGYDRSLGLGIQMVYQQPHASLDPVQKLGRGFDELMRYHAGGRLPPGHGEALHALLEQVGLEGEILNHLPRQISGGEAQRVAIARCLLLRPRLLILDEATSMLDVSTQANVLGLVRRAMGEAGGSILLISHDRALVERLCGRIYLFDEDGELRERRDT